MNMTEMKLVAQKEKRLADQMAVKSD